MPALGDPTAPRATRSSEMFRALAHRNFRLFRAGAFLSNIGTWMQTVAQGWLVPHLPHSAPPRCARRVAVSAAGAFLSNIGTWMQTVAQGWLVLHLTNSAFWLGLDGFAATSPGLVLTPLGGGYADPLDRTRLLISTH